MLQFQSGKTSTESQHIFFIHNNIFHFLLQQVWIYSIKNFPGVEIKKQKL